MQYDINYRDRVINPDLTCLRESTLPVRHSTKRFDILSLSSPDRSALAPHIDIVKLTWKEFDEMTRHSSIPNMHHFTRDAQYGLRGPKKESDLLWGLANWDGARVLLKLASSQCPTKSLIIGSGTGLIPIYIAALSAPNGQIDAVDLSYISPNLTNSTIEVPRADLDYVPKDDSLRAGHFIAYAKSVRIRPDVTINEIGSDSTGFFEKLAATEFTTRESIRNNGYDLIFVDGAHTYPQAKLDITYAWTLLKPGGVLVVDDFDKMHVLGLEAVTIALHPVLDDGYVVFFVGSDDLGNHTRVAFAIKEDGAKRPGNSVAVQDAISRATQFATKYK